MKKENYFKQFLKRTRSTTIHFFLRSLTLNGLLLLIPLLFLGFFSFLCVTRKNSEDAERRSAQTLRQADSLIESLYQYTDSACLFFSTNLRVSMQLQRAFSEPSLTLDSIRNAENLALVFQNQLYTDDYLQSIYVYYQNRYHRIFAPLNAKFLSFSPQREMMLLSWQSEANGEEVWSRFTDSPILNTESISPSLFIGKTLRRRTNGAIQGAVLLRFRSERIENSLRELLEYENQKLFLVSPDLQTLWPSDPQFTKEDFISLTKKTDPALPISQIDFGSYSAAFLQPSRSYGFSLLLLTPKTQIYQTAIGLASIYLLIIFCSILVACFIAYLKTRHDYKYLSQIIDMFQCPDTAAQQFKNVPTVLQSSNPFEYIQLNVIRLFLEHDYLKIQDSEKTTKLQLSQLQALQHQINPHFLHNTLNTIYWESIRLTGTENLCSQMISNLSAIMRYSLGNPKEDVTVLQEMDYIKKYLNIMQLRYPKRFCVRLEMAPDCASLPLKRMLLQPLVENSIYHGIKQKPEQGVIIVRAHQKRGRLWLSVFDTGQGMEKESLEALRCRLAHAYDIGETALHIGLSNTNSRILLSYGSQSGLHINSRPGSFTVVWFSIPIPS